MKRFFHKLFLFTFLISSLIILLSFFIEAKTKSKSKFILNRNINSVFIGHSHPQYAYNDSIIKHSVNLSYSMDSYFHSYIKLKFFIQQNKQLKNIFIEYSNNSIVKLMDNATYGDNTKPKMIKHMPYLSSSEHLLLFTKNPLTYLSAKIESANYYAKKIIEKQLNMTREFGRFEKNSNKLNNSKINKTPCIKPKILTSFSYLNIYYLIKIKVLAKINKLNFYLIRTPTHQKWNGREYEFYFKKFKDIYLPNEKLIDLVNFKLKNEDFGDLQHLNTKGAIKYSKYIDKTINNY